MRNVLTVLEDEMHVRFLDNCNDIIFPQLNGECDHELQAKSPISASNLRGREEMIVNIFPSLLLLGKRFLIMIDFDDKNEDEVLAWVERKINNSRTKGTSGKFSSRIQVMQRQRNVIKVRVGDNEKLIVILPLGLLNLHPTLLTKHIVEDYILEQIKIPNRISGIHDSKSIINAIGVNDDKKYTHLKNGVQSHSSCIIDYLRPLWN